MLINDNWQIDPNAGTVPSGLDAERPEGVSVGGETWTCELHCELERGRRRERQCAGGGVGGLALKIGSIATRGRVQTGGNWDWSIHPCWAEAKEIYNLGFVTYFDEQLRQGLSRTLHPAFRADVA